MTAWAEVLAGIVNWTCAEPSRVERAYGNRAFTIMGNEIHLDVLGTQSFVFSGQLSVARLLPGWEP